MNKQEALQKIKELEEFVKGCDRKPDVKIGQIYRNKDGRHYIVSWSSQTECTNDEFRLIAITGPSAGNTWSSDDGFGCSSREFDLIGDASKVLTHIEYPPT